MEEMDLQLQQAIAAARAGKETEAKVLVSRYLERDPENVHGWFLLSMLVESDAEKVEYLNKVLEIDPDHVGAQKRLNQLEDKVIQETPAIDPTDETIIDSPPQDEEIGLKEDEFALEMEEMIGEEDERQIFNENIDLIEEEPEEQTPKTLIEEEPISEELDLEEMPDWLPEEPIEDSFEDGTPPEDETLDSPVEEPDDLPQPVEVSPTEPIEEVDEPAQKKERQKYDLALAALIILVVLVVVALIYFVIYPPF